MISLQALLVSALHFLVEVSSFSYILACSKALSQDPCFLNVCIFPVNFNLYFKCAFILMHPKCVLQAPIIS